MLSKSLFKCSLCQANVVFSSSVFVSSDLCVVDDAGGEAVVI